MWRCLIYSTTENKPITTDLYSILEKQAQKRHCSVLRCNGKIISRFIILLDTSNPSLDLISQHWVQKSQWHIHIAWDLTMHGGCK